VHKDTLLFVSLFKQGVHVPDSYVAATPSLRKKGKSMKGTACSKRLRLIKERKCDEKIINPKVTFLKGSAPPALPTSGREPAAAKELCVPSPVLTFRMPSRYV
jgi:hypothetical protein